MKTTISVIPTGNYTFTTEGLSQDSSDYKGVRVVFDVTAITQTRTPTLVATIQYYDDVRQVWMDLLSGPAVTATATQELVIYPGVTAATNSKLSDCLPQEWRVKVTHSNSNYTEPFEELTVAGDNNDLTFTGINLGAAANGYVVTFEEADPLDVEWDSQSNTLTIGIVLGETTSAEILAAVNASDAPIEVTLTEGSTGTSVYAELPSDLTLAQGVTEVVEVELVESSATLDPAGDNNGLVFTVTGEGATGDGKTIELTGDETPAGVWSAPTLTIGPISLPTTANEIKAAADATEIPVTVTVEGNGTGTYQSMPQQVVLAGGLDAVSPVTMVKAYDTLAETGDNNDLLFTATADGIAGNGITVDFDQVDEADLDGVYASEELTISGMRYDTTANDLIAKVDASGAPFSGVAEGTGEGVYAALPAQLELTGGVDAVAPVAQVEAVGHIFPSGSNNDLTFTSVSLGAEGNGITVSFGVDNSAAATWTAGTKTLHIDLVLNTTTAADIIALVAAIAEPACPVVVTTDGSGLGTYSAAPDSIVLSGGVTEVVEVVGVAASCTLTAAGDNNNIVFTADSTGTGANGILITFDNTNGVTASQEGSAISVEGITLGTTAAQIRTAVNRDLTSVLVTNAPGNDGSGAYTAVPSSLELANGVDEVVEVIAAAATATLTMAGTNNNVTFTAESVGSAGNGITISFTTAGALAASWNAGTDTLTVENVTYTTTAANVRTAVEAISTPFAVSYTSGNGTGTYSAIPSPVVTSGGVGAVAPVAQVEAYDVLSTEGDTNDLLFTAEAHTGTAGNGWVITFVEDTEASAEWDSNDGVLTIGVVLGTTTSNQVIAAVAASGAPIVATNIAPSNGGGTWSALPNDIDLEGGVDGGQATYRVTAQTLD